MLKMPILKDIQITISHQIADQQNSFDLYMEDASMAASLLMTVRN